MHVPCLPPPSPHPARRPSPAQLTAEEHYENAEMAFAMENLDLARSSFKRALDMEPEVRRRSSILIRPFCRPLGRAAIPNSFWCSCVAA